MGKLRRYMSACSSRLVPHVSIVMDGSPVLRTAFCWRHPADVVLSSAAHTSIPQMRQAAKLNAHLILHFLTRVAELAVACHLDVYTTREAAAALLNYSLCMS